MRRVILSNLDLMILNKYRENCLYDPNGEIKYAEKKILVFLMQYL
jgi:hypothetical protein